MAKAKPEEITLISSAKLAEALSTSETDIKSYAAKMPSTKIGLIKGANGSFICNQTKFMDELKSISAHKEAVHGKKVRAGRKAARTRNKKKVAAARK